MDNISTTGYVANEMYDRMNYGSGNYGSLYAGNQVLAAQSHADGTATKEAIDCNQGLIRDQNNSFENATRDRQVAGLMAQISGIEINALRSNADMLAAITDNAKDAALCCCDAKLEACKNTAEIKALVISENAATRELIRGDALAAANAKIIQLETVNALSNNHH